MQTTVTINKDLEEVYLLSGSILAYSTLFPFVLSWIKIKLPIYLNALRVLFFVSFISTYSNDLFAELYRNNLFVGVIYLTIEFLIFGIIYHSQINDTNVKKYVKYSTIVIVAFSLINLAFIQGFFNQNSFTRSIVSFATICFTIIYFWYLLNNLEVENLFTHPMFWINSGILMVAATSFIIFLFSGYLFQVEDYNPVMTFWILKNTFGVIRNLLFAYAFWLNFKLVRSSA